MKQRTKKTPLFLFLRMASNARCFFFLLLALSFSLKTHARDSKFFNKLTKNPKENKESISVLAPTLAPSPSPEPEPEVVGHGYGLYGHDPYEKYESPSTKTNPTKTPQFNEEFSKQSNSKGYSNNNYFNGNGYVSERQGMSDTRYLENGKYFYDVSQDDVSSFHDKEDNKGNNGYGNQEKQGMSDTTFSENGKYFYDVNNEKQENSRFNTNNNEKENKDIEAEKQGMSDTRFLENGKYFYDVNNEERVENAHFNTNKENESGKYWYDANNEDEKIDEFDVNNNRNGNEDGEFEVEKQGMSDTRYLENGKYFYDVNNENEQNNDNYNSKHIRGDGDVGFHSKDNVEYAKRYYNGYETQGRGGYNNNYYHNDNNYDSKQGSRGYNYPKKFPKYEYDTMEEYDREQGYIDPNVHNVP